jgi:DNA-binding NarL/FixJ family response regulator
MRLLLVDDHVMFREGLVSLMRTYPDIEVVGEAGSVAQAISLAEELCPEVVLLDYELPDGQGPEASQAILCGNPDVRVVFLTVYNGSEQLFEALRSGASGYLLKSLSIAKMVASLRGVMNGEAALSRHMMTSIIHEFSQLPPAARPGNPSISQLTMREIEILQDLAAGLSNEEISAHFTLSDATVKNHVHHILHKLGLKNRREAAKFARENGLGG